MVVRLSARRRHARTPHLLILHAGLIATSIMSSSFSFRRSRSKLNRDDAFAELYGAIATVYAAAAAMKPEWHAEWENRVEEPLPIRYGFGSPVAEAGGNDTRFAVRLLQRNRWKSRIEPLFSPSDVEKLAGFAVIAGAVSQRLVEITDTHAGHLLGDEIDWINAAIEQFDEATRQRRKIAALGETGSTEIAAAVYQPVYIAIQLADRLAERLFREWEAKQ